MKGVIKWFSRNHVAANSLMLAVLLAGFYTWFQLRKEMFPEVSVDAISIGIPYPKRGKKKPRKLDTDDKVGVQHDPPRRVRTRLRRKQKIEGLG